MGADTRPVLETRRLRKNYEAELAPVRALRGVDLAVRSGEFVAVMGPSGCGKSTLLSLIAGLDAPSDGEIVVAGESLIGKDENELARMRREHIGVVFQFFNLLEGMTALENVTLPAVIAGTPRAAAESPACCPAACASGSPSPGLSPTSRRSCSPTSRPGPWTRRAARRS
jgi:putative ABC transport system ATP-binding protein